MNRFDDIRPYRDDEINAAMQRIAASDFLPTLAAFALPAMELDAVREMVRGIDSIDMFQTLVMVPVNEQIIGRTINRLTFNGLQSLDPNRRYLFVSNHRDIMLDSCLLQYLLHENGHQTTEITFGANLMTHPLVIDIGKSNKMFKVVRGGSMKDFYEASLRNSQYIRHAICDKRQSVWIAQRNGRTKDGLDRTEPGLIRMFASSCPDDKLQALDSLNIVPVAISYEWETCDMLKTLELYTAQSGRYVKKPGEDLNSILTGILAQKGNVHIEICQPIATDELMALDHLTKQEYFKAVAQLIDNRINFAYRLHPNNYIAHDLRHGTSRFNAHYTADQREAFVRHIAQVNAYDDCDIDQLTDIFLGIYANAINNKAQALTKL